MLSRYPLLLIALLALLGCREEPQPSAQAEPGEALSAGSATVMQADAKAFSMPLANLSPQRRLDFSVGNSFFHSPWVMAPASTTARDGLGPLFNTNACKNCHIKDGRGHPPAPEASQAVSLLVRLSLPGIPDNPQQAVIPEPIYGGQLQDMAIPGVAPEGRVRLDYHPLIQRFADGSEIELIRPQLRLEQLGYGPLHSDTLFSLRIAPPMIGLGLLEAIPEAALLANADPDDGNADGISGRPNYSFDRATGQMALGRFGWKAGQPSLSQQNADAFFNDMGLSSTLFPGNTCTALQQDCQQQPHGGVPEVSDSVLAQVLFYVRTLGVPARRRVDDPQVLKGKALFQQAKCQACHVPQFTTRPDAAEPELAKQIIRPYSDLLLHDMGEGLADQRPEFQATGREWRTPPLWGIGLTQNVSGHTRFLHDGRARNLMEAILWHGGEAEASRHALLTFNTQERAALLAFLESL